MRASKRLKRKVGTRPVRRKIYVFAEGQNTEPQYIRAYQRFACSSIVEVICDTQNGVPKTLLSLAEEKKFEISRRRYQRENGNRDEVWIVFDRDEHPDVDETLARAESLGIQTGYSNPCFEVWLILHFADYDRDEHRHLTQKECENLCAGYTRASRKVPDFKELLVHVQAAEQRAETLKNRRDADGGHAPLTTVHNLTKAMRVK
ncbi:RloB family protein [Roseobacter sp. MH60115]|uniref:RloB family protein n=1 Tax=Roseobacter sp. MH60115 TaxID=2785324 RepID=UPI0018A31EE8|nr:RloB family protein [Roseobacter sp. MH60115]